MGGGDVVNKDIMRQAGFAKEVEAVENKKCPFCGCDPIEKGFRDELSKREFEISGLCQDCQDDTFGTQ